MPSIKNNIINHLCKYLDISLRKDVLFAGLLGSYMNGEEVYAYSDFDILFIIKSNKGGTIKKSTILGLINLSEKLSKKYNIEISFLTHTKFDLKEYVDIEYLTHYSWAKVFIGNQERFNKTFYNIIKNKNSNTSKRKSLIYYNIIHARFNIVRKYISINKFNTKSPEVAKATILIDKIIEMVDWFLIYDGLYATSKKEIIDEFSKVRTNFDLTILDEILIIRSNMGSPKDIKKITSFNKRAIDFVNNLTELIIKKHKNQ